jgi:transcriptional regulator GlxA family with amidase domain
MSAFEIGVALFDGVEELDFAGPYEVLTAWSRFTDRDVRVRTVADGEVTCAHGLRVVPDVGWGDVDRLDVLVMPGGDVRAVAADEAFVGRMRDLAGAGTLLTSVCTGAFVYAEAGLLDGRRATTHWGSIDALRGYAAIEVDADARFVDTGEVVTAAGVSAGIDMALHLVARLESDERARQVRRYIQYDPQPPV